MKTLKQRRKWFLDNRRITIWEVADNVAISFGLCQAIFTDVLGMIGCSIKMAFNDDFSNEIFFNVEPHFLLETIWIRKVIVYVMWRRRHIVIDIALGFITSCFISPKNNIFRVSMQYTALTRGHLRSVELEKKTFTLHYKKKGFTMNENCHR